MTTYRTGMDTITKSAACGIEQVKWVIRGTKDGRYTAFGILAWDHADAMKVATKTYEVEVQSCGLFTSSTERDEQRHRASIAYLRPTSPKETP